MYWNGNFSRSCTRLWTWLIETWDVLKLKYNCNIYQTGSRLIETWDVLKSKSFINYCPGFLD